MIMTVGLLVVGGCTEAGTSVEAVTGPPAGPEPAIPPEDLRNRLTDPETREEAVWALLSHLDIGVYTAAGEQLLPGRERSEDDFYLYDFEIPILVRMAGEPPRTLDHLSAFLRAVSGMELGVDALEDLYTEMFRVVPDDPVSRMFTADPPGEPWQVTPLEEWVLFWSLLPSEDQEAARSSTPVFMGALGFPPMATGHCDVTGKEEADGGLADKYLETVGGEITKALYETLKERGGVLGDLAELRLALGEAVGALGGIFDAARMKLIVDNIDLTIDADRGSTHRYHDTAGETAADSAVEVTVRAYWNGPQPPDEVECGRLKLMGDFPPPGPLKDVGVRFLLDDTLTKHGYIRRRSDQNTARQLTGPDGKLGVWFEAKAERPPEAQRLGEQWIHRQTGRIRAEFDVGGSMGEFFNLAAVVVDIGGDLIDLFVVEYPVTVEYHMIDRWVIEAASPVEAIGAEVPLETMVRFLGRFEFDDEGRIVGEGRLVYESRCLSVSKDVDITGCAVFDDEGVPTAFRLDFVPRSGDPQVEFSGCSVEDTMAWIFFDGPMFSGIEYVMGETTLEIPAEEFGQASLPVEAISPEPAPFQGVDARLDLVFTVVPDLER
ncbi:MAG: hypothetical protein KatS3mg011_1647 [Acidimicrobiia bacterium]|nr:MAG: hypothetical protein KatS3mg011_1647 [Acidimicrobiia bacterium]